MLVKVEWEERRRFVVLIGPSLPALSSLLIGVKQQQARSECGLTPLEFRGKLGLPKTVAM
jgi:hypothetical protein